MNFQLRVRAKGGDLLMAKPVNSIVAGRAIAAEQDGAHSYAIIDNGPGKLLLESGPVIGGTCQATVQYAGKE